MAVFIISANTTKVIANNINKNSVEEISKKSDKIITPKAAIK